MMTPDPRTERSDICGVIIIGGTGLEWICIRKPHAKIYRSRKGKTIYGGNPSADQHYCVPRYPNRKRNQ